MRPLCLYREQERALRCRPIAWLHTTAGLGSPMGAGRQSCPPVAIHICVLTGAPWRRSETRPLPAVWRAPIRPQRRPIVQRRPTEGRGTVIPWPVVRGPISHCASPVALPLKPSPAILRRLGRATTGYVNHPQAAMGSRHRPGTASGTGRRSTPRLCAPAGDPTLITPVILILLFHGHRRLSQYMQ